MVWCKSCTAYSLTCMVDTFLCCEVCGKVIDQNNFSEETSFTKDASGRSRAVGSRVNSIQSDLSISRQRVLDNARLNLENMAEKLGISGGDSMVSPALRIFTLAIERGFTRGRNSEQVQAACLYLVCREQKKPYLLIDFSEYLKVNVYVLGAVFLQLCELLRLQEHPIVQKLVDPSLFIHKFTDVFMGGLNKDKEIFKKVSRTALRIIASMKCDWMQTGRKPSGLCGAAIYISALSHGVKCSKLDIVGVVHICEATLTKRLIEFENTTSGCLTIEELNTWAKERDLEYTSSAKQPHIAAGSSELLCQHKESKQPHFAYGLCRECYDEFVELSGGLEGGSNPPAFQCSEQARMSKTSSEDSLYGQYKDYFEEKLSSPNASGNESCQTTEPPTYNNSDGYGNESETLSDIDDDEVNDYLYNEEEKVLKKQIWEMMNRDYLEEQATKEAAIAAAKVAFEANLENCSDAARELAAEAVAKTRKERQLKQANEAKKSTTARTAAEATLQMLAKKRPGSLKFNKDVLDKLFDESHVHNDLPQMSEIEAQTSDMELESEDAYNDEDDAQKGEMELGSYTDGGYEFEENVYGDDFYYGNEGDGYADCDYYGF